MMDNATLIPNENDKLDKSILGLLALNVEYGIMPPLDHLLKAICPHLDVEAIPDLFDTHPELKKELEHAWEQKKFAGVRVMGP
jgi:hypothetical protein